MLISFLFSTTSPVDCLQRHFVASSFPTCLLILHKDMDGFHRGFFSSVISTKRGSSEHFKHLLLAPSVELPTNQPNQATPNQSSPNQPELNQIKPKLAKPTLPNRTKSNRIKAMKRPRPKVSPTHIQPTLPGTGHACEGHCQALPGTQQPPRWSSGTHERFIQILL